MPVEQKGPRGFQMVDEAEDPTAPVGPTGPMNFGTLVLSLATSTLVHLGEGPPEGVDASEGRASEAPPANLPLAQQTIEILEMLREKTEGNLDAEESRLLTGVLHDLRMRYVEATGSQDS